MNRKPSDILDFLRNASSEPEPVSPAAPPDAPPQTRPDRSDPGPHKSPRMLVLRRSQVMVASVAVGLVVILAFLLGMAATSTDDRVPALLGVRVWGIRAITYNDTKSGRMQASATKKALQARNLEEVTLQRVRSKGEIVVMLGAWLTDPTDNRRQKELLATVRKLQQRGKMAFPDAYLWSIQR